MKLVISNPIIENGSIVGYEVNDGKAVRRVKKEDVFKIVEMKDTNCRIVLDGKNEKHLVFEDNYSQSNIYKRYRVLERVPYGNTIGLRCRVSDGSETTLSLQRAWELGIKGQMENIKACVVNNLATIFYDKDLLDSMGSRGS